MHHAVANVFPRFGPSPSHFSLVHCVALFVLVGHCNNFCFGFTKRSKKLQCVLFTVKTVKECFSNEPYPFVQDLN